MPVGDVGTGGLKGDDSGPLTEVQAVEISELLGDEKVTTVVGGGATSAEVGVLGRQGVLIDIIWMRKDRAIVAMIGLWGGIVVGLRRKMIGCVGLCG